MAPPFAKDPKALAINQKSTSGTASPAARTPAAATTTTRRFRARRSFLSLIDAQRTATHLEAIGLLNRVLRFIGRHIDEGESPGTPGLAIVDELDRFDFAVALEEPTH